MTNPTDQDLEFCRRLAQTLTTIPGFEHPTPAALDAVASDLLEHCENFAEAQAIVQIARQKWQRWRGTHGLIELIQRQRPAPMAGNQARDYGPKPPVDCTTCNDFGTYYHENQNHWCECPAGRELRLKYPHLVDGLNRKRWKAPAEAAAAPARPRITEADIDLAFTERQHQTEQMLAQAQAILADEDASRDRQEIAREILNSHHAPEAKSH